MNERPTLGVVIGRFQTPYLHDGYHHLIGAAKAKCSRVLIAVGVSRGALSHIHPLDFVTRERMIKSAYADATVVAVEDRASDKVWSDFLDNLIGELFPDYSVTLFGSRDSFLPHYRGGHPWELIPEVPGVNATELRVKVGGESLDSAEFRAGIIYATTKQTFPTSFQTVDMAIRHGGEPKVLLGRKEGEDGWRFPGGFVDPEDLGLEYTVRREAKEELGDIEISDPVYIASIRVNDHRYRKSPHKILTALFSATYVFGPIKAGDDLAEVEWKNIEGLEAVMIDSHKPLARAFLESLAKKS